MRGSLYYFHPNGNSVEYDEANKECMNEGYQLPIAYDKEVMEDIEELQGMGIN